MNEILQECAGERDRAAGHPGFAGVCAFGASAARRARGGAGPAPPRGAPPGAPALTVDVDESWMLLFELAFAAGMREGERYALMPYELEQRDGVPGINVQQQIQQYGKP